MFKNSCLIRSNVKLIKRLFANGFPKSKLEYQELISKPLELPKNPKLNQIAILGATNLLRFITTHNICGESSKIHTTRENLKGIYTENNVQIELTDTPGCVTSKHAVEKRLEPNFLKDPDYSCNYSNIIAILYDCSIRYEPQIARQLLKLLYKHRDKKSILILTKIDLLKDNFKKQIIADKLTGSNSSIPNRRRFGNRMTLEKADMEELFKMTEAKEIKKSDTFYDNIKPIEDDQTHWPYFSRTFFVSAFDYIGIEELRKYFIETSYPNPWLHNSSLITETHPNKIIVNIIKSRILDNVTGPAAYNLNVSIVDWLITDNGSIEIVSRAKADNDFYIRSIIGPKGRSIVRINNEVMQILSDLYRCPVNFRLDLKYKDPQLMGKKKKSENKQKKAKDKDLI